MHRRLEGGYLVDVNPGVYNCAGTGTATTTNMTFGVQYGNQTGGFLGQDSMGVYRSNLWGPDRDLDYWTAREAGLVPDPERRAMKLLATICDEERFSLYCHIGSIAALGNVTKHLYIVRRYCTVTEMEDGRQIANWCVMTRDRHLIPETDHVVVLKNLIEGEELAYRATGNRIGWGTEGSHMPDPYRASFLPEAKVSPNQAIADFEELPRQMERMKTEAWESNRSKVWKAWLSHHALLQQAKNTVLHRIPERNVMTEYDAEVQALRQRLATMQGPPPEPAYRTPLEAPLCRQDGTFV